MQLNQKQKFLIATISVIAVVFAMWLFNPFPLYFLNDDLIHIPLSKNGDLFQRNSFRPIGDLSVQLDYLLWGKNAAGYHFTNLLLHLLNTLLVYFLSKILIRKYANAESYHWQSVMVALLFFIYAFHSEAIFWILGRSGSLGTLFFIPALIFYLRRHESKTSFMLSIFFFILGLFAYESVWIFPLIVLLISFVDYKYLNTSKKKDAGYISIVIIVFILHLLIRNYFINEVAGYYEASAFFEGNVTQLFGNLFRLVTRTFLPPVNNKIYLFTGAFILFMLLMVCVRFYLKSKDKSAYLLLVVTSLFISCLPYLSLGISTHNVEGERYLYMPSIFASIMLVVFIYTITTNKNIQIFVWFLLVMYNLFFLYKSKTYYTTASAISKTTFQQINLLKGKQRLFIDSLPQTVNGALIFRLGFDEGAKWLKNSGTVDSIFIISVKQNNTNWSSIYEAQNPEIFASATFTQLLVRDSTHRQTYIVQKVQPMQFNQLTDAWFIFKNNNLEVIK